MKKAAKPSTQGKPPLASTPTPTKSLLFEKAKADLSGNNTVFKKPTVSGDRTPKSHLQKNYLSKSQDNLASTLRKKAAAAAASQNGGGDGKNGNKENVGTSSPVPSSRSKTHKTPTTPIRKAHSIQNLDTATSAPMNQRTASTPVKTPDFKKAASTQNISKGKAQLLRQRISAPANIMAYNAELLASFEKEKKTLEGRISELIQVTESRKTEIEKYKFEIRNLKELIPAHGVQEELDILRSENHLLKDRLHELGVSVEHITDSEKLSMLRRANTDEEISQPGDAKEYRRFEATAEHGLSVAEVSYITPEHPSSLSFENSNWDRQSNKSSDAMSEVSLACLQDRILQMEETHYSTSEELQATLQELTDLQDAVNELTEENVLLTDEKYVLLESLCAQTEKLENARMQLEHLKALLVSESEGRDRSENERQLVALVKSTQEEKEELLLKQSELSHTCFATENENRELQDVISALRDKIQLLEAKNESLLADRKAADKQVMELREAASNEQIEIQRLKMVLENEKSKVAELEQYCNAADKSDLEELVETARHEKDKVEEKLADVQLELGHCQCEVSRLKEHIESLEQELKVTKNNAKMDTSNFVYKMEKKDAERADMQQEMVTLRDHIDQLEQDCERYLEEKKTFMSKITELEDQLKTVRHRNADIEVELKEMRLRFEEESTEWKQFQLDLQTAVVVANDIKAETQEDMEKIVSDNASLREENKSLKAEMEELQGDLEKWRSQQENKVRNDLRGRVMCTMDRELQVLRQGRKISDVAPVGITSAQNAQNLSVKTLIASIEQQVKTGGTTPIYSPLSPSLPSSQASSRRNSVDSCMSGGTNKSETPIKSPVTFERRSSAPPEAHLRSVLRKTPDGKERERTPISHRHTFTGILHYDNVQKPVTDDAKATPPNGRSEVDSAKKPLTSILSTKSSINSHRNSIGEHEKKDQKDPLVDLVKKTGGSKRNALLKWCQHKTTSYANIDITNFSSSWNDGLAFCALMHLYLPNMIPYHELNTQDKKRNFSLAFKAAESVGIPSTLNLNDMACIERPDWQAVMSYVTSIYKHFEVDSKQS